MVSGETPRRRISVTHCSCNIWSHESAWRPTRGVSRLLKQVQQERQPNSNHTSAPVTFDQLSAVLSVCSTLPYHCHPRMTVAASFAIGGSGPRSIPVHRRRVWLSHCPLGLPGGGKPIPCMVYSYQIWGSLGECGIEGLVGEHASPRCIDQNDCGRGGALQPAVPELVGAPQRAATP